MPFRKENFSLKAYNTFGLDVSATEVFFLKNLSDLPSIPSLNEALILGGGSNVLLTADIKRPVIINQLQGIELNPVDEDQMILKIASGENWHQTVLFAVEQNLGGIENLSLIPGSVGAAPMQNIGAYGVEIKDVLLDVEAMDLHSKEQVIFSSKECHFGYRDSIFKKDAKGRFFITAIRIKLSRRNHQLNISYGAIQDVLEAEGIKKPKIADVSRAVIKIRQSKLPDPDILGNSGSFFKNPVIPLEKFDELKKEYADLPSYKVEGGQIKLAAGWLIESLGWKGKRIGNTGSHKDQALVLVNYGNASGSEIEELSLAIQESVKTKYGIELETEVNIIKK